MFETILTSIATSGLIVWLARTWITERLSQSIRHEYNAKLAAFQSELKAEADVSLERLRSNLQITASKRNIEYSRIHEKRLEIISELAGRLDAFHQRVSTYVSAFEFAGGPTKEERRKAAADAFTQFNEYFRPRRFFLPEHTVEKIEAFRSKLYDISIEFMFYVEQGREMRSDPNKNIDVWTKASDYTTKEAPKLLADLEADFRQVLGIDDGKA